MITLGGIIPAPGENSVNINTSISFTIVDDGTGIDISSLIIHINGILVFKDLNFQDGYNGAGSSIDPSGNNFEVVIDPTDTLSINKVYSVDVKVKNLKGRYFNNPFSFKTLSNAPFLSSSTPKPDDTLKFPQVISLRFEDNFNTIPIVSATISINGLKYIELGVIKSECNGSLSKIEILPVPTNGLTIDIDPIEALKNGEYELSYSVQNSIGKKLSGKINFTVEKKEEVLPLTFPQIEFLGFFQGIKRVSNVGTGKSLLIEWNKPVKRTYQNVSYVLVYENELRLNVFDSPKYIATTESLEATVSGLTTGKSLSYGARAFELPNGILNPNGMEEVSTGFYKVPNSTEVAATVLPTDLNIQVLSTEGYPDAGLLFIGSEVVSYNSVDRLNNIFNLTLDGRGLINSIPDTYFENTPIRLFLDCTDRNTVILMATPNYHDDEESNRYLKGNGVVMTDYSDNDREFFQKFDYCGWRSSRPQDTIYGKDDCGTYLGGEFNGLKGFNIYDRMLAQEEILIETTGEPVIFLKRIWDGITCSCANNRKMSAKVKSCQSCYGTTYEGGYIQYEYSRRNDKRILLSFKEMQDKLQYGEKEGLMQTAEPSAWTLAQPTIRDRDLIVRFDFTNDIEFIYEVVTVTRSKNFKRKFGKQDLTLKKLDKTDIVYTFPLNLLNINKPS